MLLRRASSLPPFSSRHFVCSFRTSTKLLEGQRKKNDFLKGCFAPIATPFLNEKQVDGAALAKLASNLGESPLQGLAVLGSNGEFSSVNMEEKKMVLKTVKVHSLFSFLFSHILHLKGSCGTLQVFTRRHWVYYFEGNDRIDKLR